MASMSHAPKRQSPYLPNEGLRLISYCPLCNTHYNPLSAKVLEERDDAHLIHIECRKCGSLIVALVLTGGLGISSVGLVTDLTSDDVLRFKDSDGITPNDVIELHEVMQSTEMLDHLRRLTAPL